MNRLVLMENGIFAVSDEDGNVREHDHLGAGVYYRDTRYLSALEFRINGELPELLNSSGEHNFMGNIQLANPALELADGTRVRPQSISIRRNRFIGHGLHERIGLFNYNAFSVPVELTLRLAADFRDMFDVRGWRRPERGTIAAPAYADCCLTLGYVGLDGVSRVARIVFDREPSEVRMDDPDRQRELEVRAAASLPDATVAVVERAPHAIGAEVVFRLTLRPQKPEAITLQVIPHEGDETATAPDFDGGVGHLRRSYERWVDEDCAAIETDNQVFNRLLQRSVLDLRVLTRESAAGPMPVAGIPWFACPFGRDSIITALQTLTLNPALAVGTLRFLAAHQATGFDDWRDAEPGKILHELRLGEMARTDEVPHAAYYGALDSTPLFVLLFAETMRWLDDEDLFRELLPSVERALEWIDCHGDLDGDGYLEYFRRSQRGIRNQCWKDSYDSLAYPDGRLVEPPVAPVEVQGYVYAAKAGLAEVLRRHGQSERAERLALEAAKLRRGFNRDFWLSEEGFFAQALDAEKRPVPAISSNPGHCLYAGIVDPDKAEQVVARLASDDLLSGWGIRTLSSRMATFNPMSYHNGSVWPHDNALIVAGLKRYGCHEAANEVISQLFQAGLRFRYYRLPELFCGFPRDRRYESAPAQYPVSCSPQAWAAGSAILLFQAMLGLRPDAAAGRLEVDPGLPEWLKWASVRNLRVGRARVDLRVEREGDRVRLDVRRSRGKIQVVLAG